MFISYIYFHGDDILFCIAQVKRFKPKLVAVRNESLVDELQEALSGLEDKPEIIPGEQGVIEVASASGFHC